MAPWQTCCSVAVALCVTLSGGGLGVRPADPQPAAPTTDSAGRPLPVGYLQERLHWAIVRRDLERVRALLASGFPLRTPAEGVSGSLETAFRTGDVEMVRLLLSSAPHDAGAWPAAISSAVVGAGHHEQIMREVLAHHLGSVDLSAAAALAAAHGRDAALRALLEACADPLALCESPSDAGAPKRLLSIARSGSVAAPTGAGATWRWLLPAYAEAARRGERVAEELGITELMAAAYRGDFPAVEQFLRHGIGTAVEADADGWTALHWAAAGSGDASVIEALLRAGASTEPAGAKPYADVPLMLAAASGNAAAARALLDAGADIRAPRRARTEFPLMVAARFGQIEAAHVLIAAAGGLDPETRRDLFSVAAFEAATGRHWDLVLTLIDAGIDPDYLSGWAHPVSIMEAVAWAPAGGGEVVEALFAAGAASGSGDRARGQRKALDKAIASGNTEVFGRLLTPGRATTWAVMVAAALGRTAFLRELLDAGADLEDLERRGVSPLALAALSGSVDSMRLLLERGAALSLPTWSDFEPMIAAARGGEPEVIAFLLAAGASVNFVARDGMTPLQAAVRLGNIEAVEALLRAGADPARVAWDAPPLIIQAAQSKHPGGPHVLRLLAGAGLDVNTVDGDGKTPLDHAEAAGAGHEIVETLVELGARPGPGRR